ncbi:MAG: hypothetical protein ACR2N4_12070 [Jatrophihabitans sp.]
MTAVASAPAGRLLRVIGCLLIAIGFVTAMTGAGLAGRSAIGAVIDSFAGDTYTAPASVDGRLGRGSYLIMQLTETDDASGRPLFSTPVSISADRVQVTGPAGVPLPIYRSSHSHLDRDAGVFTAAVSFEVARAGQYRVEVAGPADARFVVVRDLATSFHATAGKLRVATLGATVLLAGLLMLVVGLIRAQPAEPVSRAGQPPPGRYWDGPGQPPPARYWDGQRWLP